MNRFLKIDSKRGFSRATFITNMETKNVAMKNFFIEDQVFQFALYSLWLEMVPIGFTLETWKDKQISGKWVGRNNNKLTWPGFSFSSLLLFPLASFLWENFWSQIQISCPTILGALFLLTYTTHNISILLSWHAKKVLGQKKSEHLNCREASLPSCLKFWNAKKQLQKFSKIYRQVKWLPSSRCRYQEQASLRWENC